ncbi:MAG: response regulator, partial [Acidobacteria bacterium]|nr:response regulator [Acidobacteriota bacterium]
TGLGLSTVYGIVQQSGGHIDVVSEPGKGACFLIYFPRSPRIALVPEPGIPVEKSNAGSETLLLVEDEESLLKLGRVILEAKGYRILEATNGREALELCGSYAGPIHLLITDMVMPGMGGRRLAARLRRIRPKTRVLYISGYMNPSTEADLIPEAGTDFLQKPFTPEALVRRVREILDRD